MSQFQLLNNIDHRDTRVLHHFAKRYGDNLSNITAFPTEFAELQKEYAIVVRHNADTDSFYAVVLLGLAAEENLYLSDQQTNGWDARYIPAMLEKGPFRIGFQQQGPTREPVVHIDNQHPKVNTQHGQPLFLAEGGNSNYLQHITALLQRIHQGMAVAPAMFNALNQLQLLQPINIDFDLQNGEKHRLTGNYCIDASALAALRGPALEQLHQAGYLQPAFAMLHSMSNISSLIERKNRQLQAATRLA